MVVVLLEDVLPLDYAIPVHVFGREASEAYELVTVSVGGGAVAVAGGTTVVPDGGLELLRGASTIVVPGYADAADRELPGSLTRALVSAHRGGVRLVSICSGAFALARAGVLDGLTVTTHWSLCAQLAERFPGVTVDQSVLVAGTDSVVTSGGVMAGVDLCLHLLNVDLGSAAARHVARRIVMAPRPADGQRQFVEKAVVPPGDDVIARARQWMLVSLEQNLTVHGVATRFSMSERTFHRRFREKTGVPPLTWLRDQRIARAKELLESSDLSIEDIASRVGFGTAANLRQQFRRATSVSPREHRRSFAFGRV